MRDFFLRSWKTTLAGMLIGVPIIANEVVSLYASGKPISIRSVAVAGGIAILGLLSKDADVSSR